METENPAADQLPEAESLPDGFSSTTDPLPPPPHHLNASHHTNSKKLHPNMEDSGGDPSQTNSALKETSLPGSVENKKVVIFMVDQFHQFFLSTLYRYCSRIKVEEVKRAISRMGNRKAAGPNETPMEFSKSTDRAGLEWLRYARNEGGVQWFRCTRTKLIYKIATTTREASETKRKTVKRTFKSEKEFLEFTLKYQQVLAERDSGFFSFKDPLVPLLPNGPPDAGWDCPPPSFLAFASSSSDPTAKQVCSMFRHDPVDSSNGSEHSPKLVSLLCNA
ncbi:hypothetical protein MTR67_018072 [Solanum verrucosum]|uniref:Uncharacterized protein n=1 Tax=Solanum verrucosum TaxID=315347 RepID=A0AAF0QJ25_SOLVR|nr:hypothetical protein MTR67_018072 [Solanum verrucosum]